jgi:aspartyl protease family protein
LAARVLIVRSRLLWILLIGLGLGFLLLVLRHEDGTVAGMTTDEFSGVVIKVTLMVFIGSMLVTLFRERFSQALQAGLFWLIVAAVLAIGYTYRAELRDTGNRVLAELMPGRAATRGRVVEIARGRTGDFQVAAEVNGARLPMVLDTGATSVVLTLDAAKAAGLPLEVLSYNVNVDTANGRARAAAVTLDRLAVGSITERSVPALIVPAGLLKSNLLGMSFLNRLESWEVRGDRLMMRGFP